MRVALLGTGKMGSALAARVAEGGHDLTVWNRTRSRAKELGLGRVASTPAEAVGEAEIVLSSLTGAEAVRVAYLGDAGALSAAHGQHFVEMSTAGPDVLAELATPISQTGSRLVDAPVVGAPPLVRQGAALIVVGGAAADVTFVRPLLELFGEARHVGPLGSGARLKLVTNSMLGVLMLAASELQVAGESIGLEGEAVFGVLRHLVPSLEVRREGLLHDRHAPALFAVRDLLKDLGLALEDYRHEHVSAPLTALVRELVEEASAESAELDISAVIRRYRPAD